MFDKYTNIKPQKEQPSSISSKEPKDKSPKAFIYSNTDLTLEE